MFVKEYVTPASNACNPLGNGLVCNPVVFHSRVDVEQLTGLSDDAMGRRAVDKLLARLATRTTADIDQTGARPAIVILGDNNTVCLGDTFLELLKQQQEAKAPQVPLNE